MISKKVDFFIVGEQKSGTTSMYYYLQQHPQVSMSATKEPCFFCTDFIEESNNFHKRNYYFDYQNLDQYLGLFEQANNNQIWGEASSVYFYSKVSAKNIHHYNPQAKIIIMLRDPVHYLFSLHQQYLKETTEEIKTLEEALDLESLRKKGKKIPKRTRVPSYLFYLERVKYLQNLKRYYRYFSPRQIKLIFFEDFIKNTQKTVYETYDFLGLSKIIIDTTPSNSSKSPSWPRLHYFLNNPRLKKIIKTYLSPHKQMKVKKILDTIFLKKTKKREKNPQLVNRLRKELKSEVTELNLFLEKNQLANVDLLELWNFY